MDIISRKDAKEQGLKFYFTGKPCKKGHLTQRRVADSRCLTCEREHSNQWSKNNRDYGNKYREINREQEKKRGREYYVKNKDKRNANHAKRKAAKLQRTPAWADQQKIKYHYSLAKYFEFITLGIKYHVDHIVPLQGKNVCGLHVPDNLQVLRSDHNHSKNNKWNWDTQSYE